MPGISGFADVAWAADPKTVFVVHGDPDAAEAFATRITAMGMRPHLPAYKERVALA